jgi:hypothetical protein
MISCAVKQTPTACLKRSGSKLPSSRWNFIRFSWSRLQAVSSRKTNSEQGLVALMRPVLGTQFHDWMTESN